MSFTKFCPELLQKPLTEMFLQMHVGQDSLSRINAKCRRTLPFIRSSMKQPVEYAKEFVPSNSMRNAVACSLTGTTGVVFWYLIQEEINSVIATDWSFIGDIGV